MTTEKATLITAEELLTLPDDGKCYELLDGELVGTMPPGGEHALVMVSASFALRAYVRDHALGAVLAGDPGIILHRNPDRVRAPDVCFISRERVPEGGIPQGYLEVVPDFMIEIVSPGDSAGEVQAKLEEWLRAGARLVWAMYPDTCSIVAYKSLQSGRVFAESELIDAAPVLPEFSIRVADLFR